MNINKQLKAIKINVSLMYYTTNIWIFFRMFELKSPISVQVINGGINGGGSNKHLVGKNFKTKQARGSFLALKNKGSYNILDAMVKLC